MSETTGTYSISVLLIQEGDWWSAQCLEYDIATQAKSLPELDYELQRVLLAHIMASVSLGKQPFEGLDPAPAEYWEMYRASKYGLNTDRMPFRAEDVPPAYIVPKPDFRIAERRPN